MSSEQAKGKAVDRWSRNRERVRARGPTKCIGLDVNRYDAESLHDQFGVRFRLVESLRVSSGSHLRRLIRS